MMHDVLAAASEVVDLQSHDTHRVKKNRPAHRRAHTRHRSKGIVDLYAGEDEATIKIDALVPKAVGLKMSAAMFSEDIEAEFKRLGIAFPQGNALVSSRPPKFYLHQETERGMVAVDAEVSLPAAMLMLMQADLVGVPIKQND
jgi:hypothetical protein